MSGKCLVSVSIQFMEVHVRQMAGSCLSQFMNVHDGQNGPFIGLQHLTIDTSGTRGHPLTEKPPPIVVQLI